MRLGPLANTLLIRHDHSDAVRSLLGQALALAAGLAAALKFSGSFSLQAKGDGPVSMLLADCTDAGALRGYARVNDEKLLLFAAGEPVTARMLLGDGYLAFTVAQGADREPQQGIVTLEGVSLAEMAEHYFTTSEQLPCRVHLAAGNTGNGLAGFCFDSGTDCRCRRYRPGAFRPRNRRKLGALPVYLADTITDAELLDDTLLPERVLYRLFHSEGVAVDKPRSLAYGCRCSRRPAGRYSGRLPSGGPGPYGDRWRIL